jgi:hypothetical protein
MYDQFSTKSAYRSDSRIVNSLQNFKRGKNLNMRTVKLIQAYHLSCFLNYNGNRKAHRDTFGILSKWQHDRGIIEEASTIMQDDGKLVTYVSEKAVWATI